MSFQALLRRLSVVVSGVILLMPAAAAAAVDIYEPTYDELKSVSSTGNLLFNQSQSYDVHLRGNGEAIVNVRVTITNAESTPIETLSFDAGKANITESVAFQQVTERQCQVIPKKPTPTPTPTPLNGSSQSVQPQRPVTDLGTGSSGSASSTPGTASNATIADCLDTDQQSPEYYYYPYNTKIYYKKADLTVSGSTLKVSLPEPVEANTNTTLVMAFAATGYVKKSMGAMNFAFDTLKVNSRVSTATVAITVDDNYQLSGAKTKVNYRQVYDSSALSAKLQSDEDTAAKWAEQGAFVSSIGSGGDLVKHASQLAANESFTVKGKYASSSFYLNTPRYIIGGVLIIALIVLYVWRYRRRKQHLAERSQASGSVPSAPPLNQADHEATVFALKKSTVGASGLRRKLTVHVNTEALPFHSVYVRISDAFVNRRVRPLFMGWLCGVLLIGFAVVAIALSQWQIENYVYDTETWEAWLYPLMLIVSYLAIGIAMLLTAFGLPWLYGRTKGQFIRIVVHLFLFLGVISILIFTYLVNTQEKPNYYDGGVCQGAELQFNSDYSSYCN